MKTLRLRGADTGQRAAAREGLGSRLDVERSA